MSKAKISDWVRRELAILSGGRCERCNTYLYEDFMTKRKVNFAEHAHMIPDSDQGPRGSKVKTTLMKEKSDNIMILCSNCHTLVDKDIQEYNIDTLRKIKMEHEKRIKYLTGLKVDNIVVPTYYFSKIGDKQVYISKEEQIDAILKDGYYPDDYEIDLSNNVTITDNVDQYYIEKVREMNEMINQYHSAILRNRLVLFALAPQPLLIYLGTRLGKASSIIVKQKSRVTNSWLWEDSKDIVNYHLIAPQKIEIQNDVCLIISISGCIEHERITSIISNPDIWVISVDNPNMNIIKSHQSVTLFSSFIMTVFETLKKHYGVDKKICIFSAMPNSLAVEFGRSWMPKVFNSMILYDSIKIDNDYKFIETINIS